MFQVDSLRLNLRLFGHESFLLNFEIRDYIFQVADGFVEEIACIVLMCNLLLQLIEPVVQLVPLRILGPHFSLEVFHLDIAVLLQLLLVLLQLHKLIVEHLDFLLLGCQHVLMVPLQPEVVHLSVTFVTNTMQCRIIFGQLTPLITASLADGTATALAILLRVAVHQLDLAGERRLT